MSIHRDGSRLWMGTGVPHPHHVGAAMGDVVGKTEAAAKSPVETGEGAEQRSAPRFTLLIRTAKLVSSGAEYLCVVRDASETGVSVRLFHPLPPEVPLTLELPNGDRHALERVWEAEGKAGFTFMKPTDIERIVEGPSRFSKRAMRINIELPCELLLGGRGVHAMLRNISQQGALVCTTERLSLVQRVKLQAEGLPEIAAKVRWRRNDHYGLSFEDNFQFGDLARIVYDLQQGGASEIPAKAAR